MHVTSGWANSDGCQLFTIGWVEPELVDEGTGPIGPGGPDAGEAGKIERKYARRPEEEYFDDERFDRPTSFPYGDLADDQPLPGEKPPEEPIAARSDTAAGPIYLPDEAEKVIKVYDKHGTLVEDIDPIALLMLMKEHEED